GNEYLVIPFQEALGGAAAVLRTHLYDSAVLEANPVQREVAEIAQVVHDSAQAGVPLTLRLFLADENLLRANGEADLRTYGGRCVRQRPHGRAGRLASYRYSPFRDVLDRSLEQVDGTDEVGDEAAVRVLVNLLRRADLV